VSRVLVADDDQSVLDAIAYSLAREQFEVDTVTDGEAALAAVRADGYDLVILNVMMPRMFGTDVLRELDRHAGTPVLLLSARDSRADRVLGLELGADDYMTKPFALSELVSRVRAILRRRDRERRLAPLVRRVGELQIDFAADTVTQAGKPVPLTPSELRLLALLAERAGEVVTRREMMEHLWRGEFVGDERAGDIHVSNLRRKLGPQTVETVRGEGYRLRLDS
jgi:DNA-binding response OmpR family regulator